MAEPQFTALSGCEQPCNAYTTVFYQDHWLWIDQRDFRSKRTMAYLRILLALADTKEKEAARALTIMRQVVAGKLPAERGGVKFLPSARTRGERKP